MAQLDCDALAVLVVRLRGDEPPKGDLSWHHWEKSTGAEPHGMPGARGRRSAQDEPFKNLPRPGSWHYFNQHIERLLFPPRGGRGARRVCCPDELYLTYREKPRGLARKARIDLLERITTPLDPSQTFGLIHLSLLPTDEQDAPTTLQWGARIATTFRRAYESFQLTLTSAQGITEITDGRPVRTLTRAIFGDPDETLERTFYSVYMAQCPTDVPPEDRREWRRAFCQRRAEMRERIQDGHAENREARQTLHIANGTTALVLGRGATVSLDGPISDSWARNFRSYWAESIVFGLLQQYALEDFQKRLADFGADLSPGISRLRQDWLKFRNVLWWSQLSGSSEIPQELVSRLRNEQGTERLFTDLEGDLATYSEHQHQEALANLQIYGSAIVVFGPLATIIGLLGATGPLLGVLLAASALIALCVLLTVRVQIKGWPT